MGLSVSAYSMYGIECDSFDEAVEILVTKGIMSEKEGSLSEDAGELCGDHPYGFTVYSCYTGEEGVLGIYIDVDDFLEDEHHSKFRISEVVKVFPEAKFHLFCQYS